MAKKKEAEASFFLIFRASAASPPAHALREAEKANIPFVAALPGALRRCSSLVWLATRRSERLALHPASAPKNGILTFSASLEGNFLLSR